MAKINTKKATEMIMTLKRANEFFEGGPSGDDRADLNKLIGCQQIAIVIGEILKVEGEAAEYAYGLLEEYCTNLFVQAENLDDKDRIIALAKENRDLLAMIESDLITDMDRVVETMYTINIVPTELQEEARTLVNEAERLMNLCEADNLGIDLEEMRTAIMLCKYKMAI